MVKRVLPLFCMLAMALLVSTAVMAQNPTGNLTGLVLDQQGAAMVGANVEVKDSTTGGIVLHRQDRPRRTFPRVEPAAGRLHSYGDS
jgi:hypothetical protein